MKRMRSITLGLAAFALVGTFATTAAAQPTVSWQQTGNSLTVQWSPVAGATQYDVVVTGAVNFSGTLPGSPTFFQVTPPPGTYVVQVRGRAGAAVGPFSAPTTIVVTSGAGPGACLPLSAPTIGSSVSGSNVTLNWGAVPGAIGYRLQVGTSPGATQFTQDFSASQRSFSSPVPFVGTFYARVIAGNACGATMSSTPDHAFTIGASTPGPSNPGGGAPPSAGPRSADPPAGQLIPRSSLGYLSTVVTQVANQFRGDLLNSCTQTGGTHTFMFRVLSALRQIDTRWGLNFKRGWPGDLSHDIVAFNPTNRPDNGESQIYLYDIIANHCPFSGSPGPNWTDVTDATWAGRGDPACAPGTFCARWTIDPYLRAGFQP
jgi:hypothetical protein